MEQLQKKRSPRSAKQPKPSIAAKGNSSFNQPSPVQPRRSGPIEAWQIQKLDRLSARASWYLAVIYGLLKQPVTVTRVGKKRFLSVGRYEVGVDERYKRNDPREKGDAPLENGLEILCNRVCRAESERVLEVGIEELWGWPA